MERKILAINNVKILISLFVIFFLVSSYAAYCSLNALIQLSISGGGKAMYSLPYIFVYGIIPFYFFAAFREKFVKQHTKWGYISFFGVTSLFIVASLILFSLSYDSYMDDFLNHPVNAVFPFDVVVLLIFELFVNISSICGYFYDKDELGIEDIPYERKLAHINIYANLGLNALLYIIMFFLGDFFMSFKAIENVSSPLGFGFIIMQMFCVIPYLSVFMYGIILFNKDMKKKYYNFIVSAVLLLNVFILLCFYIFEIFHHNFVVEVCSSFFVNFIGPLPPIGIALLTIISILQLVFGVYLLIKKNKQVKKKEN